MYRLAFALLMAIFAFASCDRGVTQAPESASLTAGQAAAIDKSVREFTRDVARHVTVEGPIAWGKYFENTPAFFMAVNGQIAFPSGAAAMSAIPNVARTYTHIELRWGNDLRVDPLAPTLADVGSSYHEVLTEASGRRIVADGFFTGTVEYQGGHWQFRNAHWSQPISSGR